MTLANDNYKMLKWLEIRETTANAWKTMRVCLFRPFSCNFNCLDAYGWSGKLLRSESHSEDYS